MFLKSTAASYAVCMGARMRTMPPAVGSGPKSTYGESRNATVWVPADGLPFTPSTSLALGWCHLMERLLRTFPGNEVGNESEPPEESEITARPAYVAMTATTSKLAANMPRLRVSGGAFFASPHRILLLTPSSDCSTVSAFAPRTHTPLCSRRSWSGFRNQGGRSCAEGRIPSLQERCRNL